MASSLQKITFTSLEDMLEQINNNFALLQNSPYFKGVPGDQGPQGQQGITGLRGTKIYACNFERFRVQFPELQNESISTLNAEWINAKIEEDDAQHTNYNKILTALNADELLEDDIVLFQSDLSLWTYDQDNNVLQDSGIRFASDANAKNIIDALIKTSLEEYVTSLEEATMYVKEYPTIATNDGKRGTDYSRINTITSYIPYLRKAGVPAKFDVTTPNIDNNKKHKYFAINDDYTNIGDDYDTSTPFNMTTISGSVREYIRTLQNGTEQTMAGNIVNPTYDKMPAMVVMQNNYKSGLIIGHTKSTTMNQYGVIYKNADGQFCFRREHRWPASRLSEQVTEFIIGSGEFLFNGTLNLLAGNTLYSDFLDTLTTPNTVRIGYGNKAGNTLLFDALNYKFSNIPSKSILELDPNGNILKADRIRVPLGEKPQYLHSIRDNVISDTNVDDRKTWFDTYYRPESEYYDRTSLIHGVMTEYTGAMMYDCIQDQLDEIWRKNEFYVLESSSTYQDVILNRLTDKVPSLHLHENLDISSSKTTSDTTTEKKISHYKILDVRTNTPYGGANDYIGIGLYYNEIIPKQIPIIAQGGLSRRTTIQPASLQRMNSLLNIELDWNKVILRAMPALSVFVTDENQELSSSYQFANPYDTYEEDVYNDLASRIDTDDFQFPNSFDKYAADEWYDSNLTTHGGYSGSNPTSKDEYRFLTGRHYVTLMRVLGTITSWIKDTFARKEDLQRVANDVVPEGAIIAWNPLITSFNYLPQATPRIQLNLSESSEQQVSNDNLRQIVQETLVASQAESEKIRNTVLATEASTTMQEVASATAANRTLATPTQASQSLATKNTESKNTTTTARGSMTMKTPTDLSIKSPIDGGLGKATGKNGLKDISFSTSKKEISKKASQSLVDTGKYLAVSSMDSNTDFKLPIGWVPCIGKSLYEVSGTSIGNIGTIHSIYRVPDLRDKIIVGYYWESTSNINAPYITGNGNYQPDLVTLQNKTIIPSSLASSMMARANLSTAPTIMSTTTDSKYAKANTIKGVVTNSSVETEEYYISQESNQVQHNSSDDKVDKFRYCPPAVRLCYIMKAPRPADGHGLYMQVSTNSYIRVYPLPTDKGFDEGQFPFFISEDSEESGVSLITGRRFTTIIDDIPAELIDNSGEIVRNQNNVEKLSQMVEDFKSPTTAQGNGMSVSEVDFSKMSQEEQNTFNDLLGKMGVDVNPSADTPLVIGAATGKSQEPAGNTVKVNNPTLLPSEQTQTTNTSTQETVEKTTTIVTNVGNKKKTITRKTLK